MFIKNMKILILFTFITGLIFSCASIEKQNVQPISIIFEEGFQNHLVSINIKEPKISTSFQLTTDDSTGLAGNLDFEATSNVLIFTIQAWQQDEPIEKAFKVHIDDGRYIGVSKTKSDFDIKQYKEKPVYD